MADEPRDRRDQDKPYADFGAALQRAREAQHLSRADVIDKLKDSYEISYPMLANLESGRRRLSDDLLVHIAPILSIGVDELRALRDVGSPPSTSGEASLSGPGDWKTSYPELVDRGRDFVIDAGANGLLSIEAKHLTSSGKSASMVQSLLTRMMLQSQELDALAAATSPDRDDDRSDRSRQLSDLIRDLRDLDQIGLVKAHSFVKGLLAAQERETTALDPVANVPLIRVPGEPFGPLQRWTIPRWMRELPHAEEAQKQGKATARMQGVFERRAETPRSVGRRIAEHFLARVGNTASLDDLWPSLQQLAVAAEAGLSMRPHGRTEPGFVDAYTWMEFVAYHPDWLPGPKHHTTIAHWVTRMAFIGSVTRGRGSGVLSFIDDCARFADEALLGRREPRPARPPIDETATQEDDA